MAFPRESSKPHLTRPSGLAGEVGQLRRDVAAALVEPTAVIDISESGDLPKKDIAGFVTTAGGVAVLQLPTPIPGRQGLLQKVNTGTNKITLARNGTEQINGAGASYDLPGSELAQTGRWHYICNPSGNWWVG